MKKSFHKMLLDVVEKSLCFMFINYRDISPSWEGGKYNLLHHRTRNSSLGAVGSGLFVDSMCVFHFFPQREKTWREEDLRFNLRARWKANTDVRSEK